VVSDTAKSTEKLESTQSYSKLSENHVQEESTTLYVIRRLKHDFLE